MQVKKLSKRYFVRKLNENDVNIIYDISCKNDIFYQYHPPFVTKQSILDDMAALPPDKTLDDKFYVGFFEEETLVAVMDLILGYPSKEIAFIGLFMMNMQYQGKGIGSQIISELLINLKLSGYQEIRLGVDKGNPQSYAFWTKNNFKIISQDQYILMGRMI